jgi:arginine-tRNA-protein transferase
MERIRLYLSTEHPCGYLPQRTARSLFVDPDFSLNPQRYEMLLYQGFRRGGDHVYRPRCNGCAACIPARIPAAAFVPNRSQRRCLKRNADLTLSITQELTDEQFELYQRYLRGRHAGGGMNPEDKPGFHNFLDCGWGTAEFWEMRCGTDLVCCAVVDRTPSALSAVYTFFDPDMDDRSLGTYAVLRQLLHAKQNRMDHVYLGYWVPGSRKMEYKRNFKPLQILSGRGWQTLEPDPIRG